MPNIAVFSLRPYHRKGTDRKTSSNRGVEEPRPSLTRRNIAENRKLPKAGKERASGAKAASFRRKNRIGS